MSTTLITDNPIFVRELRRRMRGKALIVTLCLYVAAMCVWALLTVRWGSERVINQRNNAAVASSPWTSSASYTTASTIGANLAKSILMIQAVLVLIVAPTITAAMVRSEKERQTFDFLRATAISPATYVVGALLSTVMYVALALFCGMPVLMVSHMYGGVSDLTSTTLALLGLSVVLSSVGLLISCATEKGRSGHAPLAIALLIAAVVLFGSVQWILAPLSSGSAWLGGAVGPGAVMRKVGGFLAGCLAISSLLLLMASRKLFQPEERALNYRQMAGLTVLGMTLGAWIVFDGVRRAAALPANMPDPTLVTERVGWMLTVFVGLGITIQSTSLLNRVEIGNERWRLKKRRPRLREVPEDLIFVGAVSATASLVAAGLILHAFPGQPTRLLAMGAPLAFLLFHAGLCRFMLKRLPDEFQALRWVLVIDAIILFLPILASSAATGSGPFAAFSFLVASLSPLKAAEAVLQAQHSFAPGGAIRVGLLGIAWQIALSVVVWLLAAATSARHENTHVNYEVTV